METYENFVQAQAQKLQGHASFDSSNWPMADAPVGQLATLQNQASAALDLVNDLRLRAGKLSERLLGPAPEACSTLGASASGAPRPPQGDIEMLAEVISSIHLTAGSLAKSLDRLESL